MVKYLLIAGAFVASASSAALAISTNLRPPIGCAPRDNTARILASPSPNATHPDWVGEAYIGTSWSLQATDYIDNTTGTYLRGRLVSPRGGVSKTVFVLFSEWKCERSM